jgi:Fe2+ transport system protein FeoA
LGTLEKSKLKSLADLTTSTCGIVNQLQGGKNFVSRMAALGFTVGASVRILTVQSQKLSMVQMKPKH